MSSVPTLLKTRSNKNMIRALKAQELGLDHGGHYRARGVMGFSFKIA